LARWRSKVDQSKNIELSSCVEKTVSAGEAYFPSIHWMIRAVPWLRIMLWLPTMKYFGFVFFWQWEIVGGIYYSHNQRGKYTKYSKSSLEALFVLLTTQANHAKSSCSDIRVRMDVFVPSDPSSHANPNCSCAILESPLAPPRLAYI
jgi:hypothetical protein